MLRAMIVLALALLPFGASAQQLWQGASYGMTPDEVRSAVPQAKPSERPSTVPNGARGLLTVPGVQIEGVPFDAEFFFLGEKLDQVQLTARVDQPLGQSVAFFNRLVDALRLRYGPEIDRKIRRDSLGAMGDAKWLTPDVSVDASAPMYGDSASFHVIYRSRKAGSPL